MQNKYFFKVSNWQYPTQFYWIPPVHAATYRQAVEKVYSDESLVSADLQGIETWAGIWKGGRDIFHPYDWDINI